MPEWMWWVYGVGAVFTCGLYLASEAFDGPDGEKGDDKTDTFVLLNSIITGLIWPAVWISAVLYGAKRAR